MGKIEKNVLKYGKKELNSSVSVFLDLTEPKWNEPKLPKYQNFGNFGLFGRPLIISTALLHLDKDWSRLDWKQKKIISMQNFWQDPFLISATLGQS